MIDEKLEKKSKENERSNKKNFFIKIILIFFCIGGITAFFYGTFLGEKYRKEMLSIGCNYMILIDNVSPQEVEIHDDSNKYEDGVYLHLRDEIDMELQWLHKKYKVLIYTSDYTLEGNRIKLGEIAYGYVCGTYGSLVEKIRPLFLYENKSFQCLQINNLHTKEEVLW